MRFTVVATAFLLIASPAGRALPAFDCDSQEEAGRWVPKQNVSVGWTADAFDGAGALRLTIDPAVHPFAWIRHELPDADYTGVKGLRIAYRAPVGALGSIEVRLVRLRDGGGRTVYVRSLGPLSASAGDWRVGYADFREMDLLLGPAGPPAAGSLGSEWILLVAFPLPGSARGQVGVDIDSVRFLGGEEADAAAATARREAREMLLLPEADLPGNHPRIVFRTERLAELRQAGPPGSDRAVARSTFLEAMRRIAETYDANHPLDRAVAVRDDPDLAGDAKRLAFGSALRQQAAMIEYLAAAWMLSEDRTFADLAAVALVNAATGVTADEPLLLDGGRRMLKSFYPRSLALAYDWLYTEMTPEQRRAVRRELVAHIQLIDRESRTAGWGRRPLNRVWNFAPGIMSAMGLCVLAVEHETRLGEEMLLFDARRYVRDYLVLGVDGDGAGHEGPNYLAYGLDSACYFIETLRAMGRGDLFTETNLQLTPPWLVAETLPGGGRWNNLSDCTHSQGRAAILMLLSGRLAELARSEPPVAGRLEPPTLTAPLGYLAQFSAASGQRRLSYGALAGLMGWVWQHGPGRRELASADPGSLLDQALFYEPCTPLSDPADVLADGQLFQGRGLAVSRTGYDGRELHLAVEAGPHATGHDQSDKGTFTLRAYGTDLAIDSGYGNDGDPFGGGSSYAHNVVLVDGAGQPLAHHNQSDGWITGYHHDSLADWIRVDARPAWTSRRGRDGEPVATGTMQRADRTFLLVRPRDGVPPYLVVYDDIVKDERPHDYTWQWHVPDSQRFDTAASPVRSRSWHMTVDVLTTPAGEQPGQARTTLSVPEPGRYTLYGLARAAGEELPKSDSFFVTVNDGDRLTWDFRAKGAWAWSPVRDRGEKEPRVFDLEAGECRILIETRETDAQWARWLLLPEDAPAPVAADLPDDAGISATADRAVLGEPPLQRATVTTGRDDPGWLEVHRVHPDGGELTTDWFRTSTEGAHPRLLWAVRAVRPRLLAVLVPRRDDIPAPEVVPIRSDGLVGAEVRWHAVTDRILFADGPATCEDISLEGAAALVRTRGDELVGWGIYDGRLLRYRDEVLVSERPPTGVQTGL